jgi:hypothetical protein
MMLFWGKLGRQLVVGLATYGLDPGGGISVTIPDSPEPELPSG